MNAVNPDTPGTAITLSPTCSSISCKRHSDHHANPTRRFQALRHFDDSPQLPSGYASMLIPAYIPFVWYHKMDPLVYAHYQGDLTLANLQPGKREKLLRKWHKPVVTYKSADSDPDVTDAAVAAARQAEQEIDRPHQFPVPQLRLCLRRKARWTTRKASRPAPAGCRSPTTGPAPDCARARESGFRPQARLSGQPGDIPPPVRRALLL